MTRHGILLLGLALAIAQATRAEPLGPETVVGAVGDETVRLAELGSRARSSITRLLSALEIARREALDAEIDEILAAQDPGKVPSVTLPEHSTVSEFVASFAAAFPSSSSRSSSALEKLALRVLERREAERNEERARVARRARAYIEFLVPPARDGFETVWPAIAAHVRVAEADPPLPVRSHDVEGRVRLRLFQQRSRIVETAQRSFAAIVDERLFEREAARRGLTVQALRAALAGAPVSEAEIRAYYESRKDHLEGFHPERIRSYLTFRRAAQAKERLMAALRREHPRRFLLVPPEPPRFPEGISAGARVLVVFAGYRCPVCEETQRVVDSVGKAGSTFPTVWRRPFFLPWSLPDWADAVAERCAARQLRADAFRVALREALEEGPVNPFDLAAESGIPDSGGFQACIRGPEAFQMVAADLRVAQGIGFEQTPAFLIDGLPLVGFQGEERLETLLGQE